MSVTATRPAGSLYKTVEASQTGTAVSGLDTTLLSVLVVPATTSPGNVIILDGATSITVFVGGGSSVADLTPFFIPLFLRSVSGEWTITTGADVSVIAAHA